MFNLLFICIGVICTIPTDRTIFYVFFNEIMLYSNPWTGAKNVVFVWN